MISWIKLAGVRFRTLEEQWAQKMSLQSAFLTHPVKASLTMVAPAYPHGWEGACLFLREDIQVSSLQVLSLGTRSRVTCASKCTGEVGCVQEGNASLMVTRYWMC